jgi:large subunit ribosomal protein L4
VTAHLDVRAKDGTVSGAVDLDPEVFAVQPNVPVMHQVVTAQLAAARSGTQSTKTRAEVSGGGAKPFKQKGTGRARQGSTRSPHYTGGGIALGPKPRSYRQRTPRKMVKLALRGALSDRAANGQILIVDNWDFGKPSTKAAQGALATLGITGRALLVLSRDDEVAYKSFRNIPEIDLLLVDELAAYDVLCSDLVVFTRLTLPGKSVWSEAPAPTKVAAAKPAAAEAPKAVVTEAPAVAEVPAVAEAPSAEAPAVAEVPAVAEAASAEVTEPAIEEPVTAAQEPVASATAPEVVAEGDAEAEEA